MLLRSNSRHSRVISEEAVTVTPGQPPAQECGRGLLAPGGRTRAGSRWRLPHACCLTGDGNVVQIVSGERRPDAAVGADPLADLEAEPPWARTAAACGTSSCTCPAGCRARSAGQFAEAGGRHQCRLHALPLGDGVDDDSGAVDKSGNRRRVVSGDDRCQPAVGKVARGRRRLGRPDAAGRCVKGDDVGKGAADVDGQPDRRRSSAATGAVIRRAME